MHGRDGLRPETRPPDVVAFEAELRRVAADKLPSPGVLEVLMGPPVETMEKAFQLSFSDKEILLAFSEAQLKRISLFSLQDGIPWRQILPRLLFQLILGFAGKHCSFLYACHHSFGPYPEH